ncbi:MAG TPA: PAS domain-containing protein [Flavipsychrobacter sp.]|nr:PAS domain-containing protein [Flavipsychrobacter sp.]
MDHINDSIFKTIGLAYKELPEAFFKSVIASSPGSVAVLDSNTFKVIYSNQEFSNVFGYSNDEISQSDFSFLRLLEEEQPERLNAQLQTVSHFEERKYKYVVYKLKDKNGNTGTYYCYASPINEPECEGYYYILLLRELSKWNLPFTSFDTRELFLEQFDNEGFGTFEWIKEANKLFGSKGIYKIYEIDPEQELSFELIAQYIHPDDNKKVNAVMKRALEGGNDMDIEYKIISAQQHIKIIHVVGRMIASKDGKMLKLIGSVREVTKQRMTEENLKKHLDELNRSNKELEEFAYVASHDLQEPLRKISTFSDRLNEKYKNILSGEGTMYLERMMASAENMRLLINNLLEFSRVTKSTQPFTSVNLNFILRQVKMDLELTIEETGTVIDTNDLPAIEASVTQMSQLFTNIINNAIKFHKPDKNPIIDIKADILTNEEKLSYHLPLRKAYHRIAFTDNGIGFENEYATKIFQIFQRLHGKTEYPGSGIGLAICKKIAEHHNGIIYAENIPEHGARFVIILPDKQEGNKNSDT